MNLEGNISGITDCDLTEKGRQQAGKLAEICSMEPHIDQIVCSPLKRARETAGIVAERIHAPVSIDPRLREWDYGTYEGMPRSVDGFQEAKREFGVRMKGGGESLLQLSHRVYSCIDEILLHYPGKAVLCVCHGGVCRAAETYFHDMSIEEFSHFFMGNCELRKYEI